jgi:hypothetical protein
MTLLDFIFQDGWHFFGFFLLFWTLCHWRLIVVDKSVIINKVKREEIE